MIAVISERTKLKSYKWIFCEKELSPGVSPSHTFFPEMMGISCCLLPGIIQIYAKCHCLSHGVAFCAHHPTLTFSASTVYLLLPSRAFPFQQLNAAPFCGCSAKYLPGHNCLHLYSFNLFHLQTIKNWILLCISLVVHKNTSMVNIIMQIIFLHQKTFVFKAW